jgi:hypothetical protein
MSIDAVKHEHRVGQGLVPCRPTSAAQLHDPQNRRNAL